MLCKHLRLVRNRGTRLIFGDVRSVPKSNSRIDSIFSHKTTYICSKPGIVRFYDLLCENWNYRAIFRFIVRKMKLSCDFQVYCANGCFQSCRLVPKSSTRRLYLVRNPGSCDFMVYCAKTGIIVRLFDFSCEK